MSTKTRTPKTRNDFHSTRKRSTEREDFLACLLITAVEGGISYWACCREYRWGFRSDGDEVNLAQVEVKELGEPDADWQRVTVDTMARGIRIYLNRYVAKHPPGGAPLPVQANRENDAGYFDAGDADAILQCGVFGEIVYG